MRQSTKASNVNPMAAPPQDHHGRCLRLARRSVTPAPRHGRGRRRNPAVAPAVGRLCRWSVPLSCLPHPNRADSAGPTGLSTFRLPGTFAPTNLYRPDGTIGLDPDAQVQNAIRLVFETLER